MSISKIYEQVRANGKIVYFVIVDNDNRDQLVHLQHIITYLTGPKKRDFFLLVPQTSSDHTDWDAYSYTSYRAVSPPSTHSLGSTIGRLLGGSSAEPEPTVIEYVEEGEAFGDSPLGFSFAMLDQVREKYPVDPDRITVSGLSSGGDGTWRALERGPDIFAAAVPLVSWSALKDADIEKSPQLKKIPIWAIYSSDDNGIDQAREDFARVEAAGCNVKKSEFGLCGHNAWTPAMLQADIFSWLLSRAKQDGEYIAVADSSIDPDAMQGVVEVAERDSRLPTLAPPPGEVASGQWLVASNDTKEEKMLPPPASSLVPAPPVAMILPNAANQRVVASSPYGNNQPQFSAPGPYVVQEAPAQVTVNNPAQASQQKQIDTMRLQLAYGYWYVGEYDEAARIIRKCNSQEKLAFMQSFLEFVLQTKSAEKLEAVKAFKVIESLLDELAQETATTAVPTVVYQSVKPIYETQVVIEANPGTRQYTVTVPQYESVRQAEAIEVSPSIRKVVEECEKEWVMSSHTMYGLFAADWDKESELVPDWVRKSTASELASHIMGAVQTDEKKFQALCDSVLKLDNNPMSSPWFDTTGGRLQSDIKYSLSPRGKILQAVFQELIEDEGLGKIQDADNLMQKVLDKLEMIMD